MGFWSTLRKLRPKALEPEPSAQTEPTLHAPERPTFGPEVVRLLAWGDAGGPAEVEALALLQGIRTTSAEGMTLDGLVQRSVTRPLPDRLLVAVASALLDRGDRNAARRLLATSGASSALMVRADLLAEDGDFAGAVATVERVLLRDFDLPGARERRLAWRKRLGFSSSEVRADAATMTVATPHARTPFELLREVARGGAGAVFAAKDRELGRAVAVKLYHQPERDRAQLLHEGRVAAALEGSGIVRVFDVDPDDGWLALEWATLGALRDVLTEARARPGAAAHASGLPPLRSWAPRLAAALARVHSAGWVHHDVKPANVLMSLEPGRTEAVPWLADFGSARRVGEPSPPGSLGFVSPERLAGRTSDPRDDVYGLGRVFEEALAALPADPDEGLVRTVAATCVGPSGARPSDGAAVIELLRTTLAAR